MITNFHLPKSTLLMLVSALQEGENILKIYEAAVREKIQVFQLRGRDVFEKMTDKKSFQI